MQRKRVLLIVFIAMWLAVPLLNSSLNTTSPTAEKLEPITIEDAPKLTPVNQVTLSDNDDYDYWWLDGVGI